MSNEKYDECRNCKKQLRKYDPVTACDEKTRKLAKTSFYGGFVCCYDCDKSVIICMESSMPGAGICKYADPRRLNDWSEDERY